MRTIAAFLLVLLITGVASASAAAEPQCEPGGLVSEDCNSADGQAIDDRVEVSREEEHLSPGSSPKAEPVAPGSSPVAPPAKTPFRSWTATQALWYSFGLIDEFGNPILEHDTDEVDAISGVKATKIKLVDLISFKPAAGVSQMEPQGWAVVGLETNFFATVSPQVQSGLLLGRPASVRFTPHRYLWVYGDGAKAARSVSGTSWVKSGVQEFDTTSTSHVFTEPGTYVVDLAIEFTAEYQYNAGRWRKIFGTVSAPANRLMVRAVKVKTVLVGFDCIQRPTGPGC